MGYNTPWWMVILLGMGIVFMGLGLLVLLCNAIRLIFVRKKTPAAVLVPQENEIPDRKRLLAAVAAAIAEAEGTDVSGFRIVSLNRRKQA